MSSIPYKENKVYRSTEYRHHGVRHYNICTVLQVDGVRRSTSSGSPTPKNRRRYGLWNRLRYLAEATRSSSMAPSQPGEGSSSEASGGVNFEFVLNDGQSPTQVRSHAMRASWNERKRQNSQHTNSKSRPKAIRKLAPAPSALSLPGNSAEKQGDIRPAAGAVAHKLSSPKGGSPASFERTRSAGQKSKYRKKVTEGVGSSSIEDSIPDQSHGLSETTVHKTLSRIPHPSNLFPKIGSDIQDALLSYPFPIESQDLELVHHCAYIPTSIRIPCPWGLYIRNTDMIT